MPIKNTTPSFLPTPTEFLKFITENSTDFVGVCDVNFIPTYVNKEGLHLVGLDSLEQVQQISVSDFFFPEDVDFIMNTFFPLVIKNGRNECEIRFRNHKTGDAIWMIYNVVALTDEKGTTTGYATISKNITGRKKIEEELKNSYNSFLNNIQHAPVAMCVFKGKDHVVEIANEKMLELWGTKAENVYNKPIFEGLPEAKEQGLEQLIDSVFETGEKFIAYERPVSLPRKSGLETVYVNFIFEPLKESDGTISGIIAVANDVTQQVYARKQSEISEARFRSLITQSPMAMVVFNGPDLIIELANKAMLKRWNKTEPEVVGKKLEEVFPEVKAQKFPALLSQVYNTGKVYFEKEAVSVIQDHEKQIKMYVDFEYSPLFAADGKVSGVIATVIDVTDNVNARKNVEESEARYRTLIYSSPSAIAILKGEDLVITIANDAIIGLWGKGKEIMGKPYFEALPELVEQGYKEVFAQVYKTGIPFNTVETPVSMTQNGIMQLKYYNFLLSPQLNIHGEIDGIGILATEVTSQALLNNKIKESEKKFRLLADSMPQHIWTSDPEGNLNYFNQSVFDYSGLTLQQINKDGWIQIVHPDDRERNIKEWAHAISTGNTFQLEHRFRKHTGEYRWQLSRAVPQKDENGKIQMWVGTSTDIQEQKSFRVELERQVNERASELILANELLLKSESRYHLMVEEVQDYAILYINREGIVENWNAGAEKIKGYKAEEIIGKSFHNFYTAEDRKINMPQKLLAEAAHEGKAVQEGWRVRKDGSHFWASVVITAVHDEKYNVIGFSKVTHDLTQKKNADDELKRNAALLEQKNIDLEKMNKELQSFAYISSHDLQEPLRKIQTFVTRILETENKNLSDKGKDYFARMQDAAVRMRTLIDDLLTYSRTNSSERKLEKTDLNKIVKEVKGELKEELQHKQAIIETEDLPVIDVIPFQFRQLLHNLFTNSLKFSKENKPPHIKIKSEIVTGAVINNDKLSATADYCHIIFSDNGIGFEQEFSEKIFELFQRLHGRQEYSGTGIGLAIVKKIIENHNGIITATGELNKGATFDIYIPV
ncbi:MAG: PAS domain S-box protein [Bacteroidota bacterium]